MNHAKIPEKLIFVCRVINDESIIDTFAVDKTNKKMLANAQKWASYSSKCRCEEIEFDNGPFNNIVITNLEIRREGGRAYKVVLNNKYRFDFREDVLMDVIHNTGIQAGGKLNGEFKFVQFSSQIKLVRIGSELFNEAVKFQKDAKLSIIKDLKRGCEYETKTGMKSIYITTGHSLSFTLSFKETKIKQIDTEKNTEIWLASNWLYGRNGETDLEINLEKFLINDNYNFNYRKSHTFIRQTKDYNFNADFVKIRKKKLEKFLRFARGKKQEFLNRTRGKGIFGSDGRFFDCSTELIFDKHEDPAIPAEVYSLLE